MTDESLHLEQNYQEGLLALEQLEEKAESPGFEKEVRRLEHLLKNLKLTEAAQQSLSERLEKTKSSLQERRQEASAEVKTEVDTALAELASLVVIPEGYIGEVWDTASKRFDEAKVKLEAAQELLKSKGRSLIREDQDEAWQTFKNLRKTYKKVRRQISDDLIQEAEKLYAQAEAAVGKSNALKDVRNTFKDMQTAVNALPLWRQQRQVFRKKFNALWQDLQDKDKASQGERQQRQTDGLQRLEEALERVNVLVAQKNEALDLQEKRLNEAHWSEVDPIERQFNRDERDLKSALRRQKELVAKVADARARLPKAPEEVPAEVSAETATADSSDESGASTAQVSVQAEAPEASEASNETATDASEEADEAPVAVEA
jgi:hypothetical protein